jgi:uncharacterized protein with HEPN domain
MRGDAAKQNDLICIRHMLDSAREAVEFAGEFSAQELEADRVRSLALTRCIEIIGEAAAAVSSVFRAQRPEIPWGVIVATRNRLIHAYFDIDLEVARRYSRARLAWLDHAA